MDALDVPFFTVVIPLYNKADTIKRCLLSVKRQTFHDFEVIVVNDGSTDGSELLVLQENVLLINQANQGVSAARNCGARAARSEFIAFLDADDEWKPLFLEEIKKMIETFPGAVLYGTGFERKTVNGLYIPRERPTQRECDVFRECILTLPFNSSSHVIRKQSFFEVGGYDPLVRFYEDLLLIFMLALTGMIVVNTQPCAIYNSDAIESATGKAGQNKNLSIHAPLCFVESELAKNSKTPSSLRYFSKWIIRRKCITGAFLKNGWDKNKKLKETFPNVVNCVPEFRFYSSEKLWPLGIVFLIILRCWLALRYRRVVKVIRIS